MSYIPAKKMPHITARSGEFDAETGKIVHLHPEAARIAALPKLGWIAGAAGAGLAAAVALGAFFVLRSSKPKTPARRRTRSTAKPSATPRRRTLTAKRKKAA